MSDPVGRISNSRAPEMALGCWGEYRLVRYQVLLSSRVEYVIRIGKLMMMMMTMMLRALLTNGLKQPLIKSTYTLSIFLLKDGSFFFE